MSGEAYHVLEHQHQCQNKMLIAKIHITLKEEVSDPQGMTVKGSLSRIGINNIHFSENILRIILYFCRTHQWFLCIF